MRNTNFYLILQKMNEEKNLNGNFTGRKWCSYQIQNIHSDAEKQIPRCPTSIVEIHLLADTMLTVRHVREAFEDSLHMNEAVWLSTKHKMDQNNSTERRETCLEK